MEPELVFFDESGDVTDKMFDYQSNIIEVAPGIYQSIEDYEANMAYDEARDDELLDELSK